MPNQDPYKGIDFEKITKQELKKTAIRLQNDWRDDLRSVGYVNTGEGVNSITPDFSRLDNYIVSVGSDKIQIVISEYGRRAGATPPPFKPISRWAREKGLQPRNNQSWRSMVFAICQSIGEEGLPEYGFGRKNHRKHGKEFTKNLQARIDEELGEMSVNV